MQAALAECRSSEHINISDIARRHGVGRSSLSRQFHQKTGTKHYSIESHRLLNNKQEQELLKYIRRLCKRCLPPTSKIVTNIAQELSGRVPSKNWCKRFVVRHKDELDSRYLNTLDLARHKADTRASYSQYFEIIGQKIEQYNITANNVYNMDEKGFMIGQMQKLYRVFTKELY